MKDISGQPSGFCPGNSTWPSVWDWDSRGEHLIFNLWATFPPSHLFSLEGDLLNLRRAVNHQVEVCDMCTLCPQSFWSNVLGGMSHVEDIQLIFAERSHRQVKQLVVVSPDLALSIILECNRLRALKLVRPPMKLERKRHLFYPQGHTYCMRFWEQLPRSV